MKLSIIKCKICGNESLLTHNSQVTCGKLECRKEIKKRWRSKSLIYDKECLSCGVPFVTSMSAKRYCSKICSEKIRKMRNKLGSSHWARKKNGTYQKYAGILREIGFTVIAPRGGIR